MTHPSNIITPDPRAPAPRGNAWSLVNCWMVQGDMIHRWENGLIVACTSRYAGVESHTTKLVVPSAHLSISVNGRRATNDEVRGVLADFGMEGAEEDNHACSIVRHFWLDEGRKVQPDCECKGVEETITEPDGYQWQKPRGDA